LHALFTLVSELNRFFSFITDDWNRAFWIFRLSADGDKLLGGHQRGEKQQPRHTETWSFPQPACRSEM